MEWYPHGMTIARYVSGRDPDVAQLEPYLVGTKVFRPKCFFLNAEMCRFTILSKMKHRKRGQQPSEAFFFDIMGLTNLRDSSPELQNRGFPMAMVDHRRVSTLAMNWDGMGCLLSWWFWESSVNWFVLPRLDGLEEKQVIYLRLSKYINGLLSGIRSFQELGESSYPGSNMSEAGFLGILRPILCPISTLW
jgi:hypothetical protein